MGTDAVSSAVEGTLKKAEEVAPTGTLKKSKTKKAKPERDPNCLKRPADYDEFWYEDEGEWYNEYDDNLEEGQYYEEIPEEDGYPKPDLSEVESDEIDEAAPQPQAEIKTSAPAAKPPGDPSKATAEEAVKKAQENAKNMLGGAMALGGGLLGAATGKVPQQQQQKQDPKTAQPGQQPPQPAVQEGPRPQAPQQGQRPQGPQVQRPQGPQQGQRPQGPQQGQRPQGSQQGQRPQGPQQAQRPQGPRMQGPRPQGPQQGQRPRAPMQKQNAIKGQQSQDKSGADAKATHPAVSKQKSDSSDTEKKSVQFAE